MNIRAFKKQHRVYVYQELVRNQTANCRIKLSSQVFAFFVQSLFFVIVKSKILKSRHYLLNNCFVTGHFFANLPSKKPFLVQTYNLGSLSFRKTGFFSHFLTSIHYKILKKQPKYSLTEHVLSILFRNTSSYFDPIRLCNLEQVKYHYNAGNQKKKFL